MQFALDRVLSVAGSDVVDGKVIFLADQIVDPSLSFTSETEDIVDAMNNVVMVMENGRGCTFGASNAFFNTQILAAQVGGEITSGAVEITKYDIVTLKEDGKAALTSTAKGTTAKIYKLSSDGSLMNAEAVEGEVAVKEVTIASGKTDEKYLVVYTAEVTASEKLTAFADAKNKLMNVTAEVLLRDLCKEELYYAYLVMRGKLNGEAEWSMTRDGNHAFEIRCFPEYCGDKSLVDVIIVKG
ncbi:MAG: hypothetical protein UH850_11165 [Paludibacteraceae bacterium]|nr:hypothetical protein [Paludibacteraceae bacterium]